MKKMRIFSLILAFVLLVSAMPFTAAAMDENGIIDINDLRGAISDSRLEPFLKNSQYHMEPIRNEETDTLENLLIWKATPADAHGIGFITKDAAATADLLKQPFTLSVTFYRDGSNPGPVKAANMIRIEDSTGKVKVRLSLTNRTLYYNDGGIYDSPDATKNVQVSEGGWHTLSLWIDPTQNANNIKAYLDGKQLYLGVSRSETAGLDFSVGGPQYWLTMLHNYNAGNTINAIRVKEFSLKSDDVAAAGAYNESLNLANLPMDVVKIQYKYGKDYTLFRDEGASADEALTPYVRDCWHVEKWNTTYAQYSSGDYTIYKGTLPVDLTVLSMNETTYEETPVALYLLNTSDPDAENLSAAKNTELIMELLKMGFIVVTADFNNDPRAVTPDLNWVLQDIRRQLLSSAFVSLTHHAYDSYVVPEGYSVARNIMFYDFAEHAPRGTEDYVVKMFNGGHGTA